VGSHVFIGTFDNENDTDVLLDQLIWKAEFKIIRGTWSA
jgi:hypothetical protein